MIFMREFNTLNSISLGYGYLQHAGGYWKRKHRLHYYAYLTSETYDLPHAISVSYGWSLGVDEVTLADTATGTAQGEEATNSEGWNDSKSSKNKLSGSTA